MGSEFAMGSTDSCSIGMTVHVRCGGENNSGAGAAVTMWGIILTLTVTAPVSTLSRCPMTRNSQELPDTETAIIWKTPSRAGNVAHFFESSFATLTCPPSPDSTGLMNKLAE